MIDFEKLKAPFPPDRVSWRVGSVTKDGKKAMALAYIDARDVMDRLDEVLGPQNWQCKYSHANGKTVCDIGLLIQHKDGICEWIWKADGAGDSDIEAEKGALSDAFKRAAVRWGIGRYLYDIKSPWVTINQYKQIEDSELERLKKFLPNSTDHLNVGLPGLSKTPAKFWDGKDLTLNVPKNLEGQPKAVHNKWLIENFHKGIDKAPSRSHLSRFQADNADWINALSEEAANEIYETCKIRSEQFVNH